MTGETGLTAAAVGEIVAAQPRAGTLFEQLGIDYCCGGGDTLAQACVRRGIDADTVAVLLVALPDDDRRLPAEEHDLRGASIAELCDHIVFAHHDRLRTELPRIAELLAVVVRVHGRDHAELADLRRLFAGLRAELDEHLELEERHMFPMCRALEAAGPGDQALDEGLIALLEDDHRATGDALCALRELTGGYDERRALCGTHRRLLHALHALEVDLHQHVHEENNVLFSKARALLS
jgi:regulator of cell morphogenesis and NO signaling